MTRNIRCIGVFIASWILVVGAALGVTAGEKVKTEGLVVARQHASVTIRMADRSELILVITDFTKVFIPRGPWNKKTMPFSSLEPGLWIKVQGLGNEGGQVLATAISFTANDLRTANAIQAGLTTLESRVDDNQRQIQANLVNIQSTRQQVQSDQQEIRENQQNLQRFNQRFSDLSDYDVKSTYFVYFSVGSAVLSPQARSQLLIAANNARRLRGYLLQVKGYTDSAGHAAMNQDLSMRRAQSVIAFLEESGNVALTHVLTPGAMGESNPVASNESLRGRAENRRAEIKILVNRGLSGE